MKIIGITGGIGSGKSRVASFFGQKGYPVYLADQAAKKLMVEHPSLRAEIIDLMGENAFTSEGHLDRKYIASQVFQNPSLLKKLNGIVHPAVREDFKQYVKNQHSALLFKEAAILIESGGYQDCDKVLLITAPEETRVARVCERDGLAPEQVRERIQNQWTDAQKAPYADWIVSNDEWSKTEVQLQKILQEIRGY